MRSAALPPMGACEAMQLRRDGSEAALEDRRGGIERSAGNPVGSIRKLATHWRKTSYEAVFPLSLPF